MSSALEIQSVAILIAVACSLPGCFLVLRGMSMMTDSISHTILLGIVIAFFVVEDLGSPVLMIGATIMGVITVWLTQVVSNTRIVSEDSAIGVVFPFLFSMAILLITQYAGNVHLDTNCVLMGELAFAPFDRMVILGRDLGARSMYTGGGILLTNILVIVCFYKEFKIATFDPMLAAAFGISPIVMHYALMTMVSLTAVGSFEAVGSILVVAFMIGPPNIAYLLTDDLKYMLAISSGFAAASAVLGLRMAYVLDVSIAGSMAVMVGILFAIVLLLAPKRGLMSGFIKRRKDKREVCSLIARGASFTEYVEHNRTSI